MKLLVIKHGKGKELCDLLRKELQIPEHAKNFTVRFALDEVVTVICEYMPQDMSNLSAEDIKRIQAEFETYYSDVKNAGKPMLLPR